MAEVFNLPTIGDAMVEGEIVEWFVAVGDEVVLDQVLCAVETDKSVVELTSPYRGTVLAVGGSIGDTIPVGEPLVVVGEPGEEVPEAIGAWPSARAEAPAPGPGPAPGGRVSSPVIRRLAAEQGIDLAAVVGTGVGGRITRADVEAVAAAGPAAPLAGEVDRNGSSSPVRAMPKVRRAARERGIDLATVAGSGPDGAVTLADLAGPPAVAPRAATPAAAPRRERLSNVRRAIAAHLTESVRTIPQFTSMVEFDASALLATRKALAERSGQPVPIDAIFLALLLPVVRDHPIVNAHLDGEDIVYEARRDIGVAVDTPDGLLVPVVRSADERSVDELAAEILRLAGAARARRLDPSELTGATCTLNNVGAVGLQAGTPILPVGTSTIIAIGRARPVVQLRDGHPIEVPTVTISATFDHRIIDGGGAGRFLTQLVEHLEVPALGLL